MFGIIGTLLLIAWLSDCALAFIPGFLRSPLLVLACLFLAADFVRSHVTHGDHQVARNRLDCNRSIPIPDRDVQGVPEESLAKVG